MLFGKKKTSEPRRIRQANATGKLGTQPVFSYHAQATRITQDEGRRTTKLLWTNPSKSASPRPSPRRWPRRTALVALSIVGLVVLLQCMLVDRDPKIIILTKSPTTGGQHLLRDQSAYLQAAQALLAGSLANSNKITINTAHLAQAMQEQFPELGNISIVLPVFGRQPVFHIEPTRPALLLKSSNNELFVLDDTGRAVMQAIQVPRLAALGLTVVEDQSGLSLKVGQSALPSSYVTFATEVIGQLKTKKLKILAMVLPAGTSELDVRIEGAPYLIKFNLQGDARAEAGAFLAVKQHLEREKKTPSDYIDVRVDNKVYYK